MKGNKILFAAIYIATLSGCASAGLTFKYQSRNSLELGKTTSAEARTMIGKPTKTETVTNTNGRFLTLTYTYAFASTYVATVRVLVLEFKNDTLNGRIYNSCFSKEDNTDFNFEAHKQIQQGVSQKNEVVKFLGEPSGITNYPTSLNNFASIKSEKTTSIWYWIYTTKMERGNVGTMKTKTITVAFDEKDTVCDLQTSNEIN